MNMSTLKALTWGTVAAAVLSAVMLAAGELDNERDSASGPAMGILLPADTGDGRAWLEPPSAGKRSDNERAPADQR
jgi:hypothetical protein